MVNGLLPGLMAMVCSMLGLVLAWSVILYLNNSVLVSLVWGSVHESVAKIPSSLGHYRTELVFANEF